MQKGICVCVQYLNSCCAQAWCRGRDGSGLTPRTRLFADSHMTLNKLVTLLLESCPTQALQLELHIDIWWNGTGEWKRDCCGTRPLCARPLCARPLCALASMDREQANEMFESVSLLLLLHNSRTCQAT